MSSIVSENIIAPEKRGRGRPIKNQTPEEVREKRREYFRKYRDEHREHLNALMREANKRYRAKNKKERELAHTDK